jgi:hypothetical protein
MLRKDYMKLFLMIIKRIINEVLQNSHKRLRYPLMDYKSDRYLSYNSIFI